MNKLFPKIPVLPKKRAQENFTDEPILLIFFLIVVFASACAQQPISQMTTAAPQVRSTINYGRVTAVRQVSMNDSSAAVGGALIGGTAGLVASSRQSGASRALAGTGGAIVGSQIGRLASSRQAFEYTVLIGDSTTITMVSDEAGLRRGDCVSVERGTFNNIRLADDARCMPGSRPTPVALREAESCVVAKQELLRANTNDDFDRAERRVRLLCGASVAIE